VALLTPEVFMSAAFRRLLAALVLVLFTSSAWAEAPAKAKPKAAPEPSKGLFWEAKGKKGTAYLLGSIHMADKTVYPLAPGIEKAFDRSSSLAVEADIGAATPEMQSKLMARGLYTKGETLQQNVSEETYAEVEKQGSALGLPAAALNALKPWMAALTITAVAAQKAGLNPELGLDMHFLNAARTSGKKIVELEGLDAQIKMFSDFAPEQQEAFLFYSVKEVENFDKSVREMMTAWKTGDASALEKLVNDDELSSPKLKPAMDALLTKRNVGMADKIGAALESGKTTFVVVGAAHLIGPEGVVKLLEKKGYTVERK
jgi:uncharacterized protein YbaP (TraB family)